MNDYRLNFVMTPELYWRILTQKSGTTIEITSSSKHKKPIKLTTIGGCATFKAYGVRTDGENSVFAYKDGTINFICSTYQHR